MISTSARQRRTWYFRALVFYGTVGTCATILWRNAVWLVQLQSWLAIMIGLFGAWSAEAPVETEEAE